MRSMAYVPVPGPCISPGLSSARYTLILEMPRAFAIAVGPLSLRTKRLNRISADRRLAALVDPCSLRLRNTRQLSLASQSGLELGKHSKHARKHFPTAVLVSKGSRGGWQLLVLGCGRCPGDRQLTVLRLPPSVLTRPLRTTPSLASRPWAWGSTGGPRMPDRFRPWPWQTRMRTGRQDRPEAEIAEATRCILVALHAGLLSRQHHPANFGSQGLCFFECILHVGRAHGDSGLEVSHSPSCSRDRKRR